MTNPIRLQLSRRNGFDLQKLSIETNGLPAKAVTRASRWGNPFLVGAKLLDLASIANDRAIDIVVDRVSFDGLPEVGAWYLEFNSDSAVTLFESWVSRMRATDESAVTRWLQPLAGKNLACFCEIEAPCHADVLLRLANPERGDQPREASATARPEAP